jgi:hypothetical protein
LLNALAIILAEYDLAIILAEYALAIIFRVSLAARKKKALMIANCANTINKVN